MKPARILLTGGSGFVGRQILGALKSRGAWVRMTSRQTETAMEADDVIFTPDLFRESKDWWLAALNDIDIVIHSAWYVEPGKYLNSDKNFECLKGTLTLAEAFIQSGARHFVGVGTCFEYDLSPGILSVATPLNPTSPYARSKVALFRALDQILPVHGKGVGWCRLFYLYGEGEKDGRLVSELHRKLAKGEKIALTSGKQIRDFQDVRNAGKQIATAALDKVQGPYNICSGAGRSIREIAESIADRYNRRDLLDFGAREDSSTDIPKIIGIPGNHIP